MGRHLHETSRLYPVVPHDIRGRRSLSQIHANRTGLATGVKRTYRIRQPIPFPNPALFIHASYAFHTVWPAKKTPIPKGKTTWLLPGAQASAAAPVDAKPVYSDAAALGKLMFFDAPLSASGKMSCASCHSLSHAYGPPNGLAAQLGGADLRSQGTRAVPSLRYVLNRTPIWSHPQAASLSERLSETDNAPMGGFGWDGRFNKLHDQATFPLFNPNEMANKSPAAVLAKLEQVPYAARFRDVFGQNIFADPAKGIHAGGVCDRALRAGRPEFSSVHQQVRLLPRWKIATN